MWQIMGLLDKFKKSEDHSEEKMKLLAKIIVLMQEQKFNEAIVLHEKFFDKNSAADWYTRGNLLTNQNKRQEAADCYIKAWYRLGQRCFESNNFREARQAFVNVSLFEQEIGREEWDNAAMFYYFIALHFEYQNTKDEELREELSDKIREWRKYTDTDENTTDENFLKDLIDNFQDAADELEPKIVASVSTNEIN